MHIKNYTVTLCFTTLILSDYGNVLESMHQWNIILIATALFSGTGSQQKTKKAGFFGHQGNIICFTVVWDGLVLL